jgi:GNAT superfamily N-acetyltransferase
VISAPPLAAAQLPGAPPSGFLALPHEIYRDDSCWIPEDPARAAAALGPENPWFERGHAAAFCVPDACRASVSRVPGFAVEGTPAACFGHWESAGDPSAEALVMGAVEDWARAAGAKRLFGPIDFSTANDYRVRLDPRPGELPFVGEPYNPPWYAGGFARLGLTPVRRFLGQTWRREELTRLVAAKRPAADALRARGYAFESLDVRTWVAHSGELVEVVNAIFERNYAFTPFTPAAFERQFDAAWAATLEPAASLRVRGPRGDVAGISLVYPHYAPLLVQAAGERRVALSELSHRRHAPLLDGRTFVYKTGGTAPRHRRHGVAAAMVGTVAERLLELGASSLLGGPMREDNPSIQVFGERDRTPRMYALYARELA